jgi:hypothetical protein
MKKKQSTKSIYTRIVSVDDLSGEETVAYNAKQAFMDMEDVLAYQDGQLDFHKAFLARTKKKYGIK